MNDSELKQLWKSQSIETSSYSLQQLQYDAAKFRRKTVLNNIFGCIGAMIVIVIFALFAWKSAGLFRIASVLLILGTFVMLHQLYRRAWVRELPPESLALPYVIYFRDELMRQRDALRITWAWGICPAIPGMCVLLWAMAEPNPSDFPWWIAAVFVVPLLATFVMSRFEARKLQREIDCLSRINAGTIV